MENCFPRNVVIFSIHHLFVSSFQDIAPKILRNLWNPVSKLWLWHWAAMQLLAIIKPADNSYYLSSMLKLEDIGELRACSTPHGFWLLCSIHPQNLSECMGRVLPGECKNLDWSGYGLLDLDEFQLLSWIGSENSPGITQFSFRALLGDMWDCFTSSTLHCCEAT